MQRLRFSALLILPVFVVCATEPTGRAFADDEKAPSVSQDGETSKEKSSKTPEKRLYTGRVVLLQEALKRKGITAYDEIKNQVVLETPKGKLIPIVPDWRGRAFFQDERLRNRKVDLVGYQKKGVPYLQILMVFTYNKNGERQYTDYWCDICSIPMYEIKPCDCCQAPIRLRFQSRELPEYLDLDDDPTDADGDETETPKRSSSSTRNSKP